MTSQDPKTNFKFYVKADDHKCEQQTSKEAHIDFFLPDLTCQQGSDQKSNDTCNDSPRAFDRHPDEHGHGHHSAYSQRYQVLATFYSHQSISTLDRIVPGISQVGPGRRSSHAEDATPSPVLAPRMNAAAASPAASTRVIRSTAQSTPAAANPAAADFPPVATGRIPRPAITASVSEPAAVPKRPATSGAPPKAPATAPPTIAAAISLESPPFHAAMSPPAAAPIMMPGSPNFPSGS